MKHGYARKQDANHAAIVNGLRQLGYAVLDLKSVGGGAPDLLVCGLIGQCWLVEIKTAKGVLNAKQKKWREQWNGPEPITARSLTDLLKQIQSTA